MRELTVVELARLLRDAEIAHEDYLKTGASPGGPDWAQWYAEFVLGQVPEVRRE